VDYLRVIDRLTGQKFEFPLEGDRTTVGSLEDNSIVLAGTEPYHVEIIRIEGGFKIVDRHTDMGLKVNGEWIMQKVLAHNDKIVIGPHGMVFRVPSEAKPRERVEKKNVPQRDAQKRTAPPTQAGRPAADRAETARPERSPTAGSERPPGPAGRRRSRSPVGLILTGLLVVAAAVVTWFVIDRLDETRPATAALVQHASTLEKIDEAKAKGYYEAAREMLKLLEKDSDSAVLDRAAAEKKELERLEELERRARTALGAIADSFGRETVGVVETMFSEFRNSYGELSHLEAELAELERSLPKARLIEEERLDILSLEDVQERVRRLLRNKDYATALKAWDRFLPRSDEERSAERNEVALIKRKARDEARRLFSVVANLSRENQFESIFKLASPSELARFKGTPFYDKLVTKVSEAEEAAGLVPRGLRPEDLADGDETEPTDRTGDRSRETARSRRKTPDSRRQTPDTKRKTPAIHRGNTFEEPEPTIPESEFVEIDEAIRAWKYDKAISLLQGLLTEAATREERNMVSTRLEFAHRQLWFLEDLALSLGDNPDPALRVKLKTKDGAFSGRFRSMIGSKVQIESDDDLQSFIFEEIEARSLYRLARAYPLGDEERLNMACFCLNNTLRSEFEELAAAIREKGTYRRSIESFLGMDRGTQLVVDLGYHELEGRLVPHHEWRDAILSKEIDALERKITSKNPATRNEGYAGFLDLGPVAFDALEEVLNDRHTALGEGLAGFPEMQRLTKLAGEKRKLNEACDHALELIYDTVRYFYPYGHRQGEYTKVQREVDERVSKVRAIWGNEFDEAVPGIKVSLSQKFLDIRDDMNQVALILKDITNGAFERTGDQGFANLLPTRGRTVDVRNFALDETEWEIIDSSAAIMEYNERIETSASRNEHDQVVITNKYRAMMGRKGLAINELILQAARGHSDWMSRTGTFSHFEDSSARRTPGDRMALAGYEKGSGENIHSGAGSPMGAHNGWYHSSGHHRNMLAAGHTEMACGVVGRYWTQNFGGGSEFSENLIQE